jgi:hypothetical protein
MKHVFRVDEVISMIKNGSVLALAGSESLLSKLPKGKWVGGTTPYFMGDNGGIHTNELIFVNNLSGHTVDFLIKSYSPQTISAIADDEFTNGYTLLIIPAFSLVHTSYAENAPQYKDIFNNPLLGWVSGIDQKETNRLTPKVFNGMTGEVSDSMAVALHIKLEDRKIARIDILNPFAKGSGDRISFTKTGFNIKDAIINGESKSFADYLIENNIDIKLPLVADYYGAMINIGFQNIDYENKEVNVYAPVFKNIKYAMAAPIISYIAAFEELLQKKEIHPVFSCNCLLNYLYAELEGKKTGNIKGPITFGEIAYQLLNETLVYLTIE